MDIDDTEEDHEGTSFSTYSLNHNPSFSFPRKSRSRDPQFSRHNPNFPNHDHEDSDELVDGGGGFYMVPKKKRRTTSFVPSYGPGNDPKPSLGDRNLGFEENWSERAIFALLEIWGERFVEAGRRSLRAEEWRDVAERVSEVSRLERTEVQCRNMLDSLKRKYKKEKDRIGSSKSRSNCSSNWGYFRKMDSLLDVGPATARGGGGGGGGGLACGVDSGEFVFVDTRVYLEQSNGFDEMRDSPAESEAWSGDENGNGSDSDGKGGESDGGSMRVLADSIERFAEIHGRVERDKKRQMAELERMRRDLNTELESQKRIIVERTRAEIAKIQDEDDHEDEDEDEDEDLTD